MVLDIFDATNATNNASNQGIGTILKGKRPAPGHSWTKHQALTSRPASVKNNGKRPSVQPTAFEPQEFDLATSLAKSPSLSSSFLGRIKEATERLLVLIVHPGLLDIQDFVAICTEIRRLAPHIHIFLGSPRNRADEVTAQLWKRPALVVGIGTKLGRFAPIRGTVFYSSPIGKLEQE